MLFGKLPSRVAFCITVFIYHSVSVALELDIRKPIYTHTVFSNTGCLVDSIQFIYYYHHPPPQGIWPVGILLRSGTRLRLEQMTDASRGFVNLFNVFMN